MNAWTIQKWIATRPEATFLKAALGAALGALASWLATSDVHPLLVAIGAAVIPVVVNYLNQADPRYGKGRVPFFADLANGNEMRIEGED